MREEQSWQSGASVRVELTCHATVSGLYVLKRLQLTETNSGHDSVVPKGNHDTYVNSVMTMLTSCPLDFRDTNDPDQS